MNAPHKRTHLRGTLLKLEFAACRTNACRSMTSPHRQSKIAEWKLSSAIEGVTCEKCLATVEAWQARAEGLPTKAETRAQAAHLAREAEWDAEQAAKEARDEEDLERGRRLRELEEAARPGAASTKPKPVPLLLVPGGRK